jgi:hypothetical protein
MSLRLERAALPEPLAHPAHRSQAKPQQFRDLSRALALLIELQNALAHRNRHGSHEHTLLHAFPLVKLHYLWKCSSSSPAPTDWHRRKKKNSIRGLLKITGPLPPNVRVVVSNLIYIEKEGFPTKNKLSG